MTGKLRRKILSVAVLFIVMVMAFGLSSAFADTPSVRYDDGNGSAYSSLPANHVFIRNIGLDNAVIVSGGNRYRIIRGQLGKSGKETRTILVYSGKLPGGFGTSKRTDTRDAVVRNNTMPGFTLKFPDGALLSDGTEADVIMTVDPWTLALGNSFNAGINDDTPLMAAVLSSPVGGKKLVFSVTPPKLDFSRWDHTASGKSSGATTAYRIGVTFRITEHADGTAIGAPVSASDCPAMLVGFTDLDVRDSLIRYNASLTAKYDGRYSEGVEMASGFMSPVALAPLNGPDILNQCLVEPQAVNGNTRIKAKGSQMQKLENLTGDTNDTATYYSGLIVPAAPQGFKFYWTGSVVGGKDYQGDMGTGIGGQPTVAVRAKRTAGGTLDKSYEGSWKNTTYVMNSATQYKYRPKAGYYVRSLKVDGVSRPLTEAQKLSGGTYTFTRLNKSPVGHRSVSNGQILMASDSSVYTIEAVFAPLPKYAIKKTSGTQSVRLGSTEPIDYRIEVKQTEQDAYKGQITVRDDLAGGLLSLVPDSFEVRADGGEYTVVKADDTGIEVVYDTPETAGSGQQLTITYAATVNWDRYEEGPIRNTVTDPDGNPQPGPEIPVLSDLKLRKVVTGTLRDETKKFELVLSLKGLEPDGEYRITSQGGGLARVITGGMGSGAPGGMSFTANAKGEAAVVFQCRGGDGITVCGLPVGCTYAVSEDANDHVASYRLSSELPDTGGTDGPENGPVFVRQSDANTVNRTPLSTAEEKMEAGDGIVTVTFTNTKNSAVRSGVAHHDDWLGAALAAGLITAGSLIQRRRSNTSRISSGRSFWTRRS